MNSREQHNLVQTTGLDYLSCKKRDKVYMREPSSESIFAKGKFIGILTAFELDFDEDIQNKQITIKYRSGRKYATIRL